MLCHTLTMPGVSTHALRFRCMLDHLKADHAGCFWGQKCPSCLVGQSAKLSGGHMDVGISTQSVYSCSIFPALKGPSVLTVLTLVNTSMLTCLQTLLSTLKLFTGEWKECHGMVRRL